MCGRYSLAAGEKTLVSTFQLDGPEDWQQGLRPRYNIAPGQGILAVLDDADRDCRRADFFHWGLVPAWIKDPNASRLPINARGESMAEKPSFRDALRYRRCLIPASGWYEWKRSTGKPQPWYLHPAKGKVLAFAGLWERWQSPDGSEILSACIVTTVPPPGLKAIHARMPAVLPAASWDRWLDPQLQDGGAAVGLVDTLPDACFRAHAVSEAVNSVEHDGPELIDAVPEISTDQLSFNWD